jgi:hypothetical protein
MRRGLLVGVLVAFAPVAARAEHGLAEAITVERPACLSAGALASAVAAWRKSDRLDPELRVRVVETQPRGASFVIRRGDEVLGERSIDAAGASCAELREALALTLAVSLDALRRPPAAPPPAAPPPAASPPAAPPAVAAPPVIAPPPLASPQPLPALHVPPGFLAERARPAPLAPALEVAAHAGAAFQLLPAPVALFGGSLGLRLGRPEATVAGAIRAGMLFTTGASFALGTGTATARLAAGLLDGCVLAQPGRFGLEGCAGAGGGALVARGAGFAADQEASAPWAAVHLRLAARLVVARPLALVAGVEGFVPFAIPRVEVEDPQHTVRASVPVAPAALGVLGGAVVHFP